MSEPLMPGEHEPRQAVYRSYLLRLWQANGSGASGWRASLEDPRTGEQVGFANLEQLFAFLMEQIEDVK
jgi:hypothetical protein